MTMTMTGGREVIYSKDRGLDDTDSERKVTFSTLLSLCGHSQ
jgi:hypothetical protein